MQQQASYTEGIKINLCLCSQANMCLNISCFMCQVGFAFSDRNRFVQQCPLMFAIAPYEYDLPLCGVMTGGRCLCTGDYIDAIHRDWYTDYGRLETHHGFVQWWALPSRYYTNSVRTQHTPMQGLLMAIISISNSPLTFTQCLLVQAKFN